MGARETEPGADDFSELRRLVEDMAGRSEQLRAEAEARVVKWLWATGSFFSLVPFEQERSQGVRGKLLGGEPRSRRDVHAFGFDRDDRLVLERSFGSSGVTDGEAFTVYEEGRSTTVRFLHLPEPQLGRIHEITYVDRLPTKLLTIGQRGDTLHERYEHDARGAVTGIFVERHMRSRKRPLVVHYELAADPAGVGRATRVGPDGARHPSFEYRTSAPRAEEPAAVLSKKFEAALASAIHDVVRNLATDRPAYCLVLNYEAEASGGCIPTLGLGFSKADDPAPFPRANIPDDEAWRWNPAELSSHGSADLQVRAADVLELDRRLRSLHVRGETIDVRGVCNRVATSLNRLDWSPLPVTRDFVVYAVDNDLVDLDENFALARASMAEGPR